MKFGNLEINKIFFEKSCNFMICENGFFLNLENWSKNLFVVSKFFPVGSIPSLFQRERERKKERERERERESVCDRLRKGEIIDRMEERERES